MSPAIMPLLVLSLLLSGPWGLDSRAVPVDHPKGEHIEEEAIVVVSATNITRGSSSSSSNSSYNTTWREFERFLDMERGGHASGIAELKRYFHRFGYLPSNLSSGPDAPAGVRGAINFTDAFDERFESAVTLYQSSLGLPVTGKLDAPTLAQIMSPRCGMDDRGMRGHGGGGGGRAKSIRRYNFFPGQPTWARARPMALTYAFSPINFIDYIPRADVEAAFRRAFARWAAVIPVSFLEVQGYWQANIKVGFYGGDHGDGEPFDGVLGVLAHAFSPENGRLHLDAAETWAVDLGKEQSAAAVDLESVATHEIGHVLGLGHSSVREAVMYPSLGPRTRKVELRVDDVEGVQSLYGSNPNFRLDSLLASDTSAAAGSRQGPGSRRGGALAALRRSCLGALAAALCTIIL